MWRASQRRRPMADPSALTEPSARVNAAVERFESGDLDDALEALQRELFAAEERNDEATLAQIATVSEQMADQLRGDERRDFAKLVASARRRLDALREPTVLRGTDSAAATTSTPLATPERLIGQGSAVDRLLISIPRWHKLIAWSAVAMFISIFLPWRSAEFGIIEATGWNIVGGRIAFFAVILGLGALAAHHGIGPVRVAHRTLMFIEIPAGAFCLLAAVGNAAMEGTTQFGGYLALFASIGWTTFAVIAARTPTTRSLDTEESGAEHQPGRRM